MPLEQRAALETQPWITDMPQRFDPQPYTQLARVLEGQGDRTGAARIREAREHRVRHAMRLRDMARIDGSVHAQLLPQFLTSLVRRALGWSFGAVFGYGHQPIRALWWVLGLWALAFNIYGTAYHTGQMAPNSDVILTSAHWLAAVVDGCAGPPGPDCTMPLHLWLETPAATDYESFSAGLYALDLFVPLDALGQEVTWAPSQARGFWGALGYWARMPIQLAGWIHHRGGRGGDHRAGGPQE